MMQVVSRDVIEHLSQTRVIFSSGTDVLLSLVSLRAVYRHCLVRVESLFCHCDDGLRMGEPHTAITASPMPPLAFCVSTGCRKRGSPPSGRRLRCTPVPGAQIRCGTSHHPFGYRGRHRRRRQTHASAGFRRSGACVVAAPRPRLCVGRTHCSTSGGQSAEGASPHLSRPPTRAHVPHADGDMVRCRAGRWLE